MERRCDKPLVAPGRWEEAKARAGWAPIITGPQACPRRALEEDAASRRWIGEWDRLERWGAWPHSPGDWGAQGARWSAAIEVIAAEMSRIDAERSEQ